MRISLVDNSGVWTDVILRRMSPDMVVRTHFLPDPALTHAFGKEIVTSIRGTAKHSFVFFRSQGGKVVFNRFAKGAYPFGIAKRISPEGDPWPELESSTLKHRSYKGIKRGPSFILRETGKKIFEGVAVKFVKTGRLRSEATVGWDVYGANLVEMFMTGFAPIDSPWYGLDPPPDSFAEITVAPRRVRGMQPELKNVIYQAMQNFLDFK